MTADSLTESRRASERIRAFPCKPDARARESGLDFWVMQRVFPCLRCGLAWEHFSPWCVYTAPMNVERVKYVIWAADMDRAVVFYTDLFGGRVLKQNTVIAEVEILGSVIGIHSGGEGKRTWTGLSFQVPDVITGAREVVAAGGQVAREPEPENGEPPHLAMCVDPEGNEFMLSRKRA